MATLILSALGAALVLNTTTETMLTHNFHTGQQTLYAADAGVERGIQDLIREASWSAVLAGGQMSGFRDTPPHMLPDGTSADLVAMTAALQEDTDTTYGVANGNRPVWKLYGHGPLDDLLPTKSIVAAGYADPTATGPANSRTIDQLLIGDTEGQLWRFDLTENAGSAFLGLPVRTYDAQQHHPLFASLALVNVGGSIQHIFASTGMDIVPGPMRMEQYRFVGLKDDTTKDTAAQLEYSFNLNGQSAAGGDERPTASPAVAGDVVFYTTTTEFPNDPCQCHESTLYSLTYDGSSAYGAGTGGNAGTGKAKKGKGGKSKKGGDPETVTTWEGRSTAPFVADQHLYFGVGDDLRVLGDPDDYNNGVTSQGVRITSWREVRR